MVRKFELHDIRKDHFNGSGTNNPQSFYSEQIRSEQYFKA